MRPLHFFIPILILFLFACETKNDDATEGLAPATLYYNGQIITMQGETQQTVEAVVERQGMIVFAGDKAKAMETYPDAQRADLEQKTLLPGLIEPHLHPSLAAIMLQNEIIAPYDWVLPSGVKEGVQGHEAYIERLSKSISSKAAPDEMYFVWGYHQLWHGELDRAILNEIAGDQPVGVIHRSFHEIFLNDAAIRYLGIEESEFANNPQVFWDKGHFYEGGWLALVPKMAPILLEPKAYLQGLKSMSALLLQNGVTTIAEPGFPSSDFDGELKLLFKEMENQPPYDVYLIPNGTQLYGMKGGNVEAKTFMESLDTTRAYSRPNVRFLPKQVKLFSDGAIYSQLMQMKEGYTDGHEGEWMTPLDLFKEQLMLYWNDGYKIHVHSNGDLGQQMVIDLVAEVQEENPREHHRLTLHHMGYFDAPMTDQMAELGMEASVNPYYLWALADKYSEYGLGPERAENLVALKLLVNRNIPLSFHSDFSMAPVEPLTLAWTAVNRETSMGSRFSQDQRISVYEALKAITIDAARTLNLEQEIGSIEVGKVANFTLLAEDPLEVDPMRIKDIAVEGVVYRGKYVVSKAMANSPGAWAEAEVDSMARESVAFAMGQMNSNAGLKEIKSVKKQVVNGLNFDLIFELDNGETWRAKVYRHSSGELKMEEAPKRQ